MSSKVMNRQDWAILLALSVIWGGSFLFNRIAVTALPPSTVVLCRVAIAATALLITVHMSGQRMPVDPRVWAAFVAMGALNNLVPFSLIAWGQTQIASGLAAILNATTPLFTVLFAHLLTRDEPLSPGRVAGVTLGFTGVVVMIGPTLLFNGLGSGVLAQVAVLGAAMSYAFASLYGRRFKRMGVAPLVSATGQVCTTSVLMIPVAALVDQPWTLPFPGFVAIGALLALALLCTAIAYVFYFRLLASAGATNLTLVTFLIPVSAILFGALMFGERLDLRHFGGMALIGLGLAAIDGRPFARFRRAVAGRA